MWDWMFLFCTSEDEAYAYAPTSLEKLLRDARVRELRLAPDGFA